MCVTRAGSEKSFAILQTTVFLTVKSMAQIEYTLGLVASEAQLRLQQLGEMKKFRVKIKRNKFIVRRRHWPGFTNPLHVLRGRLYEHNDETCTLVARFGYGFWARLYLFLWVGLFVLMLLPALWDPALNWRAVVFVLLAPVMAFVAVYINALIFWGSRLRIRRAVEDLFADVRLPVE